MNGTLCASKHIKNLFNEIEDFNFLLINFNTILRKSKSFLHVIEF